MQTLPELTYYSFCLIPHWNVQRCILFLYTSFTLHVIFISNFYIGIMSYFIILKIVSLKALDTAVILLSTIIAIGIDMTLISGNVFAQQQETQNSSIGTYVQGYDKGKVNAQNTFTSSGNYNSTCLPPTHSATYCLGYSTGYNLEWAKQKLSNWWMSSK